MSRVIWNEQRIARLQKQGRGSGSGAQYLPWLEVTELSSQGVSHRAFSSKTQRTHHLLSNVEHSFFLMLDWATDIVDIREQFPLPRTVTRQVAAELGVRHPCYPGTHVDTVMTVDFIVTRIRSGEEVMEAYDVKRSDGVEDTNTIEKLEIVRSACEADGVSHYLVCHDEIPQVKVNNLAWMATGPVHPAEEEPTPGFYNECATRMLLEFPAANKYQTLSAYCSSFDERLGLLRGSGLRAAKILMAQRELMPDLSRPDLPGSLLESFTFTARHGQLRAVGGLR